MKLVDQMGLLTAYEPKGVRFFDGASRREMLLVDDGERYGGWLCYRHPDGQWVTLRKATDDDRARIFGATVTP
jgi:hypothetical protein